MKRPHARSRRSLDRPIILAAVVAAATLLYGCSGSTNDHSELSEGELHSGDAEHPGMLPRTHHFTCSSGEQALVGFGSDGLQIRVAVGTAPTMTLRAPAQGRAYVGDRAKATLEGSTLTLYRKDQFPITCERVTKRQW